MAIGGWEKFKTINGLWQILAYFSDIFELFCEPRALLKSF